MRGRLSGIPWQSIRVRLVLGLLCITIPLIALLIYNNRYSVNVIHNQVANSNKNLVSVFMKQIDDQLSEAERHMMGLMLTEPNLLAMGEASPEDEYMMAKSSVSRRLTSDLIVYPYIDGFFVYSIPRGDIVETFRDELSYKQLTDLRTTVKKLATGLAEQPTHLNAAWRVQELHGENYIMRLFGDGNLYIGAWVKTKSMLKPLNVMYAGDRGASLIVDGDGQILSGTEELADAGLDFTRGFQNHYLSGEDEEYLVVGESSRKGSFSLVSVVPDRLILENLPYLARAALVVIVIALIMLPLSLWFLRKVLLLPLQKMTKAMRRIGEGNFNTKIEESPVQDEFQLVNRTFNHMITQIAELKIHIYEEQISKQRAELKHLQLQINPHFFMNSLNIVYNLAQVKQYSLIQEMTMCLVQYFRYMLQSNQSLVLLRDELQHVRNFLRIQQLRFPDRLKIEVYVPDYLQETQVPPLLLQTFVENVVKHAVRMDDTNTVTIEAMLNDLEEEPTVILSVRDNGPGFSVEALESIRSGKQLIDEKGEHIGLWNARERLRLQYGDRSWMDCYNDEPHGAVVEMGIPLKADSTQKEEKDDVSASDRG